MSVFYQDACPGISLLFWGVEQHCPFALSGRFDCIGECNMRGFAFIYFNSQFIFPVVDGGFGFIEAIAGPSCATNIAVSSARVAVVLYDVGRSLV
jgi:hypothetical protein